MDNPNGRTLIFIPTYNERGNVAEMCKQLTALDLDSDLLFMDDQSPDGTGAVLEELKQSYPRLMVVHRSGKLGIGSAHLEAIAWAYERQYDTLITLDCDFTHSPSDIPRLLEQPDRAALTVGSRHLQENSLVGWSPFRRFLTNYGHVLTKRLLKIQYDATGALRVYRIKQIPREIFDLVRARSYGFFFESMYLLSNNGVRIAEVPVILPSRMSGHSKMSLQEVGRTGKQIFTMWIGSTFRPSQYRLKPSVRPHSTAVDATQALPR